MSAAAEFGAADLRLLRRRVAAEIERLIAFLDEIEGDPDYETDSDDEMDLDFEATASEWSGVGPHRFDRGVAA